MRGAISIPARDVGYEITVTDQPPALAEVWPLLIKLEQRKGIHFHRPLDYWQEVVQRAAPQACAWLYTASLDGKPVQFVLVLRTRDMAEYCLGAVDLDSIGDRPSPSALVQWLAMRAMLSQGCRLYNLGNAWGDHLEFKKRFHPSVRVDEMPVTVVVKPLLTFLWCVIVLRCLFPLWPKVKELLRRFRRA